MKIESDCYYNDKDVKYRFIIKWSEKVLLREIQIGGFRQYQDFSLSDFSNINFIAGENNTGKTTILEAIFTWGCGFNLLPIVNTIASRVRYGFMSLQPYWLLEEILSMLFDRRSSNMDMFFGGKWDNEKTVFFNHRVRPSDLLKSYDPYYREKADFVNVRHDYLTSNSIKSDQLNFPFNPQQILVAKWEIVKSNSNDKHFSKNKDKKSINVVVPTQYIDTYDPYKYVKIIDILSHTNVSENLQIYSSLKREGMLDDMLSNIHEVYPEITSFEMIPYPDGASTPVSVLKDGEKYLPIYALGDGVQRWFYILGCMLIHRNSIICIDEVDVGIHPTAQESFCRTLITYAQKYNVQLFLTSHNLEFMDHFINASLELDKLNDVRIFTLKHDNKKIQSRVLNGKEAVHAREVYDLELR